MTRKHNLAKPRGGAKSASASGDTRRRVSKTLVQRPAAVLRRPAASLASDSPAPASGGRDLTSIYSHGVRIRCYPERRQELTDAVRARRSSRSVWDPNDWSLEMRALKAKMGDLGVGAHGGPRYKALATGKTGIDTVTGKRKSTDRDSGDVLASGSKDRSIEQLASGNKGRGIEQLGSGKKARGIDELGIGKKAGGIEKLEPGKSAAWHLAAKIAALSSWPLATKIATLSSWPLATKMRAGIAVVHQSRRPLATHNMALEQVKSSPVTVARWHHHQCPLAAQAAQVVSLCGMGSGMHCWGRLLDVGLLGQFTLSSGRMRRTATRLGSLQW